MAAHARGQFSTRTFIACCEALVPSEAMSTSTSTYSPSLRFPLIVTAAVGILMTIIGAVTRGSSAFLGGFLGAIVVVSFFGVGQYVITRVLERNPQIAMTTALLVYVLQILVLLVLLLVLRDASWLDGRWFGFTVFFGVIAWTFASLIDYLRHRPPTVVPGSSPGNPHGDDTPANQPPYDQ